MNTFLQDYHYVNYDTGVFRITKLDLAFDAMVNLVKNFVVSYLGILKWISDYLDYSVTTIVVAIASNPPAHAIRLNNENYANNWCPFYLLGSTFNMVANGTVTGLMYEYSWLENPTLGVVAPNCKLASQTYPYSHGIGQ